MVRKVGLAPTFFVSYRNKITTERNLVCELKNAKVVSNPSLNREKLFKIGEFPDNSKLKFACVARFDVGIKNLAYCLLSVTDQSVNLNATVCDNEKKIIEIIKWNIIDLSCHDVEEEKSEAQSALAKSSALILKQCCKCKKTATYCTHSNSILPEDVKKYCKKHAEETQLPMYPKLLKSNSKNGHTPYIVPLSTKKMSCNKINIVDLGKNIKRHLDVIFSEHMEKIDAILIIL